MISFACKTIDIKDIILCSFDLTKTEHSTLMYLLGQNEANTINEISEHMELERSTVQKAIAKLLTKKLVHRRQINVAGGGYRFIYGVADHDLIKDRITEIVDGWHNNVIQEIKSW